MTTNSNTNQSELQWNIDRYLLDDPTLDREAFEQQMLADTSLAEQVAASVLNMQLLAQAVSTIKPTPVAPASSPSAAPLVVPVTDRSSMHRPALWLMFTSAVLLIVAISSWQFRRFSSDDQLARIADNWNAIETLSATESLDLVLASDSSDVLTSEATTFTPQTSEDSGAESSEQSDWLVEAAREFYLATNEGAAG